MFVRSLPFAPFVALAAMFGAGCSASGEPAGQAVGPHSGPAQPSGGSAGAVPTPAPGAGNGPVLVDLPQDVPEQCEAILQLTVRDFQPTHQDFETYGGLNDIGCGMVAPALGPDAKPVFASGIGTQKRVVAGDWANLQFSACAEWNGWSPSPVITGQVTFDQWYRDTEGVNQAFPVDVTLVDDGSGALAYDSKAFFPIDNVGFGNTPGQAHNFHFTTEAHVKFGYEAGQKFTFRGDDDLWIFVNGKLALDLGGTHMPIAATIDFDAQAAALGISPGGTYQMDIFHAERHTSESNFRVETNIRCFEPVEVR